MVIWDVWGSITLTFTGDISAPLRALARSIASGTPGVIEASERVAARLFVGHDQGDAWSHLPKSGRRGKDWPPRRYLPRARRRTARTPPAAARRCTPLGGPRPPRS